MSDHSALIYQLLEESRGLQNRNAEVLAEVRASISAVQQAGAAQAQSMAELRVEIRSISDRLRETERIVDRLPHTEDTVRRLDERISAVSAVGDRRHQEVEGRIRALEGETRETGVFRRGASSLLAIIIRWAIPFVAALIGAAMVSDKIG